jgi:two-component system sensor histidine kinase VicK
MPDFADFFRKQAEASAHIHFVYAVATGQVVFVNEAYQQVLGRVPAQVNADLPDLLSLLHPDDRPFLARCYKLWVRGQLHDELEVRLHAAGQPDQWFCLTPHYNQGPEGQVLLGGDLRDISAAKHYQHNADSFNARKDTVLEILSHDMSGAFMLMQKLTRHLRQEVAPVGSPLVAEMLAILEKTSQDGVRLIRDLVSLEFLTSTNTDLRRTRVEVGSTLRVPLAQLQAAHGLLGQRFAYVLPTEPLYAELDVNKFTQVLNNLISNALKFTPDGGLVEVVVAAGQGDVRIEVRDEGIGIPAAMQPRVFERFTPARRPGLRGEPTTGLGLALCQTIVAWHAGQLSVVSTEGKGSTFTIQIPQAPGAGLKGD